MENDYLEPIPDDRIICLNISKTYNRRDPDDIRLDLYDCVRKYWVMDINRAKTANRVLAVADGVIIAEYEPESWGHIEHKGRRRCYFEGKEIVPSAYIGKRVTYRGQNPVKYINM